MSSFTPDAFGWCPDITDPRDFPFEQGILKANFLLPAREQRRSATPLELPATHILDEETLQLRLPDHCPDHTTTAVITLALVDWISRRWRGIPLNHSAKFLYQMTIRTHGGGGLMGVGLRATLKSLVRFGAPPEPMWPSQTLSHVFPSDPTLFGFRSDYASLKFYRIDARCDLAINRLTAIKYWLASGTPCLFGFSVPDCLTMQSWIPHEPNRSGILGGTAAIAMGYDDNFPQHDPRSDLRGALRVRCGWGDRWGDHGYGWLPYRYVIERLACDFWGVLHPDWTSHPDRSSGCP